MIKDVIKALLLLAGFAGAAFAQDAQPYRDPRTGLLSWQAGHPSFSLQLVQMLPDYVAAVYSSRGLPAELIEGVNRYCVFGTIITNEADQPVSYRVADWRYVTPDGQSHPVKTKSQWLEEWAAMGVPYRWSMLPDEQTFQPGDWSQGFTTIGLSPGSRFDLVYSWRHNDETHQDVLKGVRCAPADAPAH